ncbi:MAG: amidohydrolase family protein, partial [Bryobacteraceae bacterium]
MRSLAGLLLLLAQGQAQITAIRAGKLADPETGATATGQTILIDGAKITAVGANLAIPPGAKLIDLSRYTVSPGLFDAHTHLCAKNIIDRDRGDFLIMSLLDPTGYRAILGVVHAREMLEAGFTTVRDVGNAGNYADIDLRRSIREGLVPGPTIIAAGRIIAPFGGQFEQRAENAITTNAEYMFADTRDELRKAIRENIHYGAQVIKIVVDSQRYIYSESDIRFIVEEAAFAGVKVAAHCQTPEGARNAAGAGVASIEHGWRLTDETVAIAKKNGVVLVGTDLPEKVFLGFGWKEADAKRKHAERVERLKQVYKAGLPVVFGTDVMVAMKGETRGTLAISFIDSYVHAKYPPQEILQSMTTRAARLLGVEKERGSIRAGLAAD